MDASSSGINDQSLARTGKVLVLNQHHLISLELGLGLGLELSRSELQGGILATSKAQSRHCEQERY